MPVRNNPAATANREPLMSQIVTSPDRTWRVSVISRLVHTGTCYLLRGVEVENVGPRPLPLQAMKLIDRFFYLCSQSSNPFIVIGSDSPGYDRGRPVSFCILSKVDHESACSCLTPFRHWGTVWCLNSWTLKCTYMAFICSYLFTISSFFIISFILFSLYFILFSFHPSVIFATLHAWFFFSLSFTSTTFSLICFSSVPFIPSFMSPSYYSLFLCSFLSSINKRYICVDEWRLVTRVN
jgi:hypothetical protein